MTDPRKLHPITYRPDIDGLRSVAVVSVVLFHAQFVVLGTDLFSGGFVGVDVFFVISGYLITSIILREMVNGGFSITRFYERRARRILPALLTVILVSVPFAWSLMLPKAVKEFAGSILSSLAFGSNIWFWQEDGYWAEPSEFKPFLHTWSLSVEEQFYVIFPLLLLILWRFTRRYITSVLVVVFFCSLLLADVTSRTNPEAAFYLPFARGWELLAGAILAKLEMSHGRSRNTILTNIMPVSGLFLIFHAFLFFDGSTAHPSFLTLIPVAGTMLLIWYCQPGEVVTDALSSRPMVAIGLISYSFYLWHFPAFALARIWDPELSQLDLVVLIFLAMALSAASYWLVERPFRNKRLLNVRVFTATILMVTLTIAVVMGVAFSNNGLWGRYTDGQLEMLGIGEDRTVFDEYVHRLLKITRVHSEFSDANEFNDLLIIGDSYSGDVLNALDSGGFLGGLEVLSHYISSDCHNVSANSSYQEFIASENVEKCKGTVRVGDDALRSRMADAEMVLIASSWREYSTSELLPLLQAAQIETNGIVLIVGRKHFGRPDLRELVRLSSEELQSIRLEYRTHLNQIALVPKELDQNYLDLHHLFCGNSSSCPIATPGGHLISYDGGHLTQKGAAYLAELLRENPQFSESWSSAFKETRAP